ncbi:hypothetical protein E8E11_002033 [Didymella keratinophila]|nr:hypothetical protein E8E11_002033 [Didymella keratinophila]
MSYLGTATSEGGIIVVEIAGAVKHAIHRGLLIQHSEYFKTALKGPWREAEEGVVRHVDVQREPFDIFVTWLYTQRMNEPSQSEKLVNHMIDVVQLRAIVLGNRLLAPGFTEAVQVHIIESHTSRKKVAPFNVIKYAYRSLRDDSPILEMLADLHVAFYAEKPPFEDRGQPGPDVDLPPNLLSIMHKYAQKKILSAKDQVYVCDYLGHSPSVEKSYKQKCLRCARRMCDVESGSKHPLSYLSSSSSDDSDSDDSI